MLWRLTMMKIELAVVLLFVVRAMVLILMFRYSYNEIVEDFLREREKRMPERLKLMLQSAEEKTARMALGGTDTAGVEGEAETRPQERPV